MLLVDQRTNALTAAWPTDGCSLAGIGLDDEGGLILPAWPTLQFASADGARYSAVTMPIPTRFAGLIDAATRRRRVLVLEDGLRPWPVCNPHEYVVPFDWGRPSRGAENLAFCLLRDVVGLTAATGLAGALAEQVIARLPRRRNWSIAAIDLGTWAHRRGWEPGGGS